MERVVISQTEIRIPFTTQQMLANAKDFAHLTTFLFDTYKTNNHGLELGACGPCGLQFKTRDGFPHVEFVPMVFCICLHEDRDGHNELLNLFEQMRGPDASPLTDAVCDFACLQSAQEYFGDRPIRLHRDLQHVRTD